MAQEETLIAEKIKNFRKAKKMSQKDLSEKSGINISMIKKYETMDRNPKPEQLQKIADALEISSSEFLPIQISNINDILSLIMKVAEHTDLDWNIEKDENNAYIPETLTLSFREKQMNEALIEYLNYTNRLSTDNKTNTDTPSVSLEDKIYLENKYKLPLKKEKRDVANNYI